MVKIGELRVSFNRDASDKDVFGVYAFTHETGLFYCCPNIHAEAYESLDDMEIHFEKLINGTFECIPTDGGAK